MKVQDKLTTPYPLDPPNVWLRILPLISISINSISFMASQPWRFEERETERESEWGVSVRAVDTNYLKMLITPPLLCVAISAGLCELDCFHNKAYLHRKGPILHWMHEHYLICIHAKLCSYQHEMHLKQSRNVEVHRLLLTGEEKYVGKGDRV